MEQATMFDWEKYGPKVGDTIQVTFKNEYNNRPSANGVERSCMCKVININKEFGEIFLIATENIFKARSQPTALKHRWSANFNIGPYHYEIRDISIPSIDDVEEAIENTDEGLDLGGFDFWLTDYDFVSGNGYYMSRFGNIETIAPSEKLSAIPFFVFDPEIFDSYSEEDNITNNEIAFIHHNSFIAYETIYDIYKLDLNQNFDAISIPIDSDRIFLITSDNNIALNNPRAVTKYNIEKQPIVMQESQYTSLMGFNGPKSLEIFSKSYILTSDEMKELIGNLVFMGIKDRRIIEVTYIE